MNRTVPRVVRKCKMQYDNCMLFVLKIREWAYSFEVIGAADRVDYHPGVLSPSQDSEMNSWWYLDGW